MRGRYLAFWFTSTTAGRLTGGFLVAVILALVMGAVGEAAVVYCPEHQGWWCYLGFCC